MAASAKKIQKDIQKYQKLLRKEKRLQYYLTLANLHESAGDLASAEKVLDEAMGHFPDLSSVKVAAAHVLNELGRPKEARDVLEPVLTRDKDNLLAARRLAESHEKSGDLEKALQTYKSILRFRLVGQEVRGQIERLERLVSLGKQREARRGDSTFVGLPTLSLAKLYMEQGHFQEAIAIVNRILIVDPGRRECEEIRDLAQASLEKSEARRAETFFPRKEPPPDQLSEKTPERAAEDRTEREARERAEKDAKEKADRETRDREELATREEADRVAKDEAEREAKERAELEARDKAKKELEERAKREAEEKAALMARERAENEAKAKADLEEKEKAEREALEKARQEAKERAEREARESAEREAQERAEREGEVARAVEDDLALLARLQQWLDGVPVSPDG